MKGPGKPRRTKLLSWPQAKVESESEAPVAARGNPPRYLELGQASQWLG